MNTHNPKLQACWSILQQTALFRGGTTTFKTRTRHGLWHACTLYQICSNLLLRTGALSCLRYHPKKYIYTSTPILVWFQPCLKTVSTHSQLSYAHYWNAKNAHTTQAVTWAWVFSAWRSQWHCHTNSGSGRGGGGGAVTPFLNAAFCDQSINKEWAFFLSAFVSRSWNTTGTEMVHNAVLATKFIKAR